MKKIHTCNILFSLAILVPYMCSAQTNARNLLLTLIKPTHCFGQFIDLTLYNNALTELEHYIATERGPEASFSYSRIFGGAPILLAAERGHSAIIELLIACGVNLHAKVPLTEETPLHLAAKNGHVDTMNTLMRHGAEINRTNIMGRTPLHSAALGGKLSAAQALLLRGAHIDAQDYFKNTPLHYAAKNGHKEVVKFLLNRGALIQENSLQLTPIGVALDAYTLGGDVSKQQNIKEVIHSLVFFGVPRSSKNKEKLDALFGNEWLMWQPKKGKIKEILMPHLDVAELEELTTQFAMPPYVERKRPPEEPLPAKGEKKQRTE